MLLSNTSDSINDISHDSNFSENLVCDTNPCVSNPCVSDSNLADNPNFDDNAPTVDVSDLNLTDNALTVDVSDSNLTDNALTVDVSDSNLTDITNFDDNTPTWKGKVGVKRRNEQESSRRSKYLRLIPEFNMISHHATKKLGFIGLLENGNVYKGLPVKINRTSYIFLNTCPFDSLVQLLTCSYCDYQHYQNVVVGRTTEIFKIVKQLLEKGQRGIFTKKEFAEKKVISMQILDCHGLDQLESYISRRPIEELEGEIFIELYSLSNENSLAIPMIKLEDIPKVITINSQNYALTGIMQFIPGIKGNLGHFVAVCLRSTGGWEVYNDLKPEVGRVSGKVSVMPSLLIKKKKKLSKYKCK
uniref:USP domain-containing protein n=1 Tax=Strigamia maritima TaxID=126957 RepID=T1JFD6_STRMM